MTIIITALIVFFCVVCAVMAVFLIETKRIAKWTASEERLSTQRTYSHVEQGPDSLYPVKSTKDQIVNQSDKEL